ncbi:MAG: sensor histidine kinase [Monoglobaceae bacterium]
MIYSLQKKFIKICGIALSVIMLIIFLLITFFSRAQLNSAMDQITDKILSNNGRSYKIDSEHLNRPEKRGFPGLITEETKFSTRYFSVTTDKDGNVISVNTEFISSVTEEKAIEYGEKVLANQAERGWISSFRFKKQKTEIGNIITFVDGSMNLSMSVMTVLTVCTVLFVSFLIVFLLIVFLSRRAVKPIAESYEKQKQFITDANHELKTPLTLILANIDIIESEIGQNEWISDIRSESERMNTLVNQLVMLTRMDEGQKNMQFERCNISELLQDVCADFGTLAEQKNKRMAVSVEQNVWCFGDINALYHLFSILLDNAVKYCDIDGDITVSLVGGKHITVHIENTYKDINNVELNKLFDRFYRSDKSRTYNGSFGVGLSIAKSIVQNHHGKISAYKKDSSHIGFKIVLK